jgi:hypothetical protein
MCPPLDCRFSVHKRGVAPCLPLFDGLEARLRFADGTTEQVVAAACDE